MTFLEFKHRLLDLSLSQAQLAREIEKRFGERLAPAELGNIMRGIQSGNKPERVKTEAEQILEELEKEGERV